MIIPILPLLNVEQCVVICSNNVIHITFAAWKEIFGSSFIPSEFKPLFHCIPVFQIITEIGSRAGASTQHTSTSTGKSVLESYSSTMFFSIFMFIILGKTSTRVVLASALIGRVFIMLLYPPLNEVEGEYTGFTLSVHLRIILHVILCVMAGMQRIGNAEIFSALWLKCGYNAEISPYSCPNTPIRIFSAFPPHFSRIFCHTRMRRFLRVPVRIHPSAFSPQGKCGDLGYGFPSSTYQWLQDW